MSTTAGSDASEATIWQALESVKDPEIPSLSVIELGMIDGISMETGAVVVRMMPTFVGCPALETLQRDVAAAVRNAGIANVRVELVYDPPWSTDRITAEGHRKLKEFGLAPPVRNAGTIELNIQRVPCPYCDSHNTELESIFGPTLCRSIHFCHDCRQSFEHFKPVG